jgi:glycerol-3-phosphate dehydrogenase
MARRTEMWDRLGPKVDVLVVGGGVNGSGIARDAARRGLSVAVVEMNDVASGTSSASSKLVHGGLRYLEMGEFSLVFEAVSERRILMDVAPHLVNPLGFLFPIYEGSRHKPWVVNAGMWVYDGLSLFRSPKLHRNLDAAALAVEEPALRREGLKGAPLYYDCATDDARLTLETALDAILAGAVISTWTKAISLLKDDRGRVCGAVVENRHTGELREVRASVVVNASGPWTDRVLAMSRPRAEGPMLRPTKGVHIVVPREKLPLEHALLASHPRDGRVLFGIPWRPDATYIGTTDTDYEGDPSDVHATRADVDYLIDAMRAYAPNHPLTHDDVLSTWAGLRPLVRPPEAGLGESAVSREHTITVGEDGLITIAGGKLTTYRRMSAEVVDTAVKLLHLQAALPSALMPAHTDREPLPGAVGWPDDDDHGAVARKIGEAGGAGVEADTARLLADTYGMRGLEVARMVRQDPSAGERIVAGRPEIMAQVDWAVEHELAYEVEDVLARRTQLYYRDRDQGLAAAPRVAARMGARLGWDAGRRDDSVRRYAELVARSRRWRDG